MVFIVWKMTKDEALEMLVAEKSAPALSRAFIAWLYENGYEIIKSDILHNLSIKDTQS